MRWGQQQMENVRQEEHSGRETNRMNRSVYSKVYVCWHCLQVLIFTGHFRVDVEQCSTQSSVRGGGGKRTKKADLTCRGLYFFRAYAGQAPNDHNLSSCLFNYPARPDWVSQSSRMEWRRWNKNRPIPWEGCPLNPAANAAPAAPAVIIVVGEKERDGTPKQGHHHRSSHGPQAKWEEALGGEVRCDASTQRAPPAQIGSQTVLNISIWYEEE